MASNGLSSFTVHPGHHLAPRSSSVNAVFSRNPLTFSIAQVGEVKKKLFKHPFLPPAGRTCSWPAAFGGFCWETGEVGQIHSQNFRNPPLVDATRSPGKELEFYERFGFYTHTYTLSLLPKFAGIPKFQLFGVGCPNHPNHHSFLVVVKSCRRFLDTNTHAGTNRWRAFRSHQLGNRFAWCCCWLGDAHAGKFSSFASTASREPSDDG